MTIEDIKKLENAKNILKIIDDAKEFDNIITGLHEWKEPIEFKILFGINKDKENGKFEVVATNRYFISKLFLDESDFLFIINTIRHMISDKIETNKRIFKNL